MMTALMQLLIDCENNLGWIPERRRGMSLPQARALMHKMITARMIERSVTVDDLRLAYAYALRRQEKVASPMGLFALINDARDHAAAPLMLTELGRARQRAITWEQTRGDAYSELWLPRLIHAQGPGLEMVLRSWADAGRGPAGG